MWLLVVALFGLTVPNGLFIYWLLAEFHGIMPVLQDKLALAFILDALLALAIITAYFARRPIGPVRWPWFVVLSILGGLGFSLPICYWLNLRPVEVTQAQRDELEHRLEAHHSSAKPGIAWGDVKARLRAKK